MKKTITAIIFAALLCACTAAALEKEITLDYSNYTVSKQDGYEILEIHDVNVNLAQVPLSLALPIGLHDTMFPGDAVIIKTEAVSFDEPVDLKMENLASWSGKLVDRICVKNELEPRIEFVDRHESSGLLAVTARVFPVEVVDCAEGDFRLYKKITYMIEYSSESSISFLTKIPQEAFPGSMMDISVMISKLKPGTLEGEFVVVSGDEELGRTDATITEDGQIIDFEAKAPSKSGSQLVKIKYNENGAEIFTREYWIEVEGADMMIEAPEEIGLNQAFNLQILLQNNMEADSANCSVKVSKGAVDVIRKKQDFGISPGLNNLWMEIRTTGVEMGDYVMDVDCRLGEDKFSTFQMISIGQKKEENDGGEGSATITGILIVLVLFAIVVYLVRLYMKSD